MKNSAAISNYYVKGRVCLIYDSPAVNLAAFPSASGSRIAAGSRPLQSEWSVPLMPSAIRGGISRRMKKEHDA
jgi:hypothetical protein